MADGTTFPAGSKPAPAERRPADAWALHQTVRLPVIGILLLIAVAMTFSARNVDLDRAASETGGAIMAIFGVGESRVVNGLSNFLETAFPFVVEERREVRRVQGLDRDNLPWLARIENVTEQEYSALDNKFTEVTTEYLVEPLGYLRRVLVKMWETIEMAFWGTLLALLIAMPLGVLGASNYTPHRAVYSVARALCSFNRAMPELILALIFVLMYGFGPVAGILALGLHTSGFLGKFFADDIENADPGPQRALRVTGASRLKVLRFAVLPQVLPQYYAYLQYILERNIRTATVLGIVGAGGIGTELKGRWDIFDYGHVSTILLVIFLTVMLLEFLTQRLRAKAI